MYISSSERQLWNTLIVERYVTYFFRRTLDENNDDDDVDRVICRLCTISPITELSPFCRINSRGKKRLLRNCPTF